MSEFMCVFFNSIILLHPFYDFVLGLYSTIKLHTVLSGQLNESERKPNKMKRATILTFYTFCTGQTFTDYNRKVKKLAEV